MTRFRPRSGHICHICGTSFEVSGELDPQSHRLTRTPDACPACTAPLKPSYPISVGAAKDLVLTYYRLAEYRRAYGTPRRFLERRCARPDDVDRYLELVLALDLDGWQASDAETNARCGPARGSRGETAAIRRARADLQSGRLPRALRTVAEQVKALLRQEREHYLQIYAQRRGEPPA